jgi:anti-sigma B factor antagonist
MSELKEIELTKEEMFLLAKPQCAELDEQHTSDMQKKVQEAAEKASELPVILDLSEVHFLPSLSIGALVSLFQHSKQRQQRFILVGLQTEVRQTLAVCRLDKLFEIYDTVETATQKIQLRNEEQA